MKRYKNEGALGKAGMGNVDVGLVKDEVSIEEDVEVEGAWPVGNPRGTVAPEGVLEVEQRVQKRRRGEACIQGNNGVDEARLIRKTNGRSGVKGRTAEDAAKGGESLGRRGKRGLRRAGRAGDVGSHSDIGDRHGFRLAREGGG